MAAAAAIAAAQRNARKKQALKEKQRRRNQNRISNERAGLQEEFEVPGIGLETLEPTIHGSDYDPMGTLSTGLTEKFEIVDTDGTTGPVDYSHLGRFGKVCEASHRLAQNQNFNLFIIGVILVAGVLVGLQTYEELENNETIAVVDTLVLMIFCFEVLLKILGEGPKPWRYFVGSDWNWNNFDFLIVFLSLPIWDWGNSVALLRLMRLLRIIKLVKKIPQLYMIVMGLIGGMKAIMYILILMFIIFYLYAIIGFYMFVPNDQFHFGNIWDGLLTLWRLSTFEDWTDVLYINYYGCDSEYDSGFYTSIREDANGYGVLFCPQNYSGANPVLAIIYFVSFVFISALVMLSLFVGAVTMSMTESMERLKSEKEQIAREKAMEEARQKTLASGSEAPQPKNSRFIAARSSVNMLAQFGKRLSSRISSGSFTGSEMGSKVAPEDLNDVSKGSKSSLKRKRSLTGLGTSVRNLLPQMHQDHQSHGDLNNAEVARLRHLIFVAVGMQEMEKEQEEEETAHDTVFKHAWSRLARRCDFVVNHNYFVNFITAVIVAAGALVGASTFDHDETTRTILGALDTVILVIFCSEVFLKTVAAEFQPWQYFYRRGAVQGWNLFDYVVVAGSLLPGSGSTITILRLLRLLRVLKLLKALPELQIIVVALLNGLGSISYIAVILFLVFYLFAIVGMILFQQSDPWHFGTLHISLFTLFRCATLEDWTDVMYINMYGCDMYGYDGMEELCVAPQSWGFLSSIYFVLFTLIGGLVLMTLFIGVVTTSMEEASSDQKEQIEILKRVEKLRDDMGLPHETIDLYKEIFHAIDIDGGGSIDEEELAIGMISIGEMFSKDDIKAMVAQVDDDNSGEIDMAEFVEFMDVFKRAVERYNAPEAKQARLEAKLRDAAERELDSRNTAQEEHRQFAKRRNQTFAIKG
ncbi:Sodium channel protein type 11 subunit alpha (Peripheral nerve sodium channel 5) (PN5) (Sensory neuron sodium channel 2) (Sodium channel protein type XI subunit alpha) (Voltage-gated sodium channel subunit alpha Nav1.9) (hNaN) [Durusdinium trenchii]|uniref:EF-hand domain-containing protein n=1 Tax=Durusdinium trenchii TaxID=1381693 RepID=A0ABP0QW42_9DINO